MCLKSWLNFLFTVDAVKKGKVKEEVVRERVKPLFYTRMRLGQFDPPDDNPYSKLNNSIVESPEHRALALEAAQKSFVLLKNKNILPLKQGAYTKVAVSLNKEHFDLIIGFIKSDFPRKAKAARIGVDIPA